MEAIEIYGQINEEGNVILNTPLTIRNKRVRIILLVENESDLENELIEGYKATYQEDLEISNDFENLK
ncbi:hypothetical protein V9L05_16575 [Bernardetia sp. Wsw4-3y2]|uniref:hypothetical protein n=1 Tax=Bernardetia sp. Wsw4-3y2 TaxID=3127471 RepID=UPI0030D300A9